MRSNFCRLMPASTTKEVNHLMPTETTVVQDFPTNTPTARPAQSAEISHCGESIYGAQSLGDSEITQDDDTQHRLDHARLAKIAEIFSLHVPDIPLVALLLQVPIQHLDSLQHALLVLDLEIHFQKDVQQFFMDANKETTLFDLAVLLQKDTH